MTCRAPELFEVPSNCEIDEKTDVWSLGCTLYAMAYGEYVADGKGKMCRSCKLGYCSSKDIPSTIKPNMKIP